MKLARILLASAAVTLLAACNSDPIGPSGTPERLKPRHSITTDSTTVDSDGISGDGTSGEMEEPSTCHDTAVVAGGTTTIVRMCDGRGPIMGSGG